MVERLTAAEFKMRSVRYLDAGLFHYQAETNPIPEDHNKDGRINPLAWAFQADSASPNSFSKLIRYEGFLQREFPRPPDLYKTQDERRARLAEAAASQPEATPAVPKKEKTKRTQFAPAATAEATQSDNLTSKPLQFRP